MRLTGEIGDFAGIPVIQNDSVLPNRAMIFDGPHLKAVVIAATRPTLHFPLTEALAAEMGESLWYFDRAKWPHREPVDPATWFHLNVSKERQ